MKNTSQKKNYFAPEVIQTSAMDCGPASLKCLFEGFNIPVSYGRLREVCHTDIDGTSIDVMEETANQLGLPAEQVLIPDDHLIIKGTNNLPAIAIVKIPGGFTHFVVVWSFYKNFVQIMDPATGRKWVPWEKFRDTLYIHSMRVPAKDWREWAGSEDFLVPLSERMLNLGLTGEEVQSLINEAVSDKSWRAISSLDAAVRMASGILKKKGLKKGNEAKKIVTKLFHENCHETGSKLLQIPTEYRNACEEPGNENGILLKGVVLVRISFSKNIQTKQNETRIPGIIKEQLTNDSVNTIKQKPTNVLKKIITLIKNDRLYRPIIILSTLFLTALVVVLEAVFLRAVINGWGGIYSQAQNVTVFISLGLILFLSLFFEFTVSGGAYTIGRRLEIKLRKLFINKIPTLPDLYFQSRPVSDMAQRSHTIYSIRSLPRQAGLFVQKIFEFILTCVGILWIFPGSLLPLMILMLFAIGLPVLAQPLLSERNMKVLTHTGALGRFYMDALIGLVAVKSYGAEKSIRAEHNNLLSEWRTSSMDFYKSVVSVEAIQLVTTFFIIGWIVFNFLTSTGNKINILLLVYWSLNLPVISKEIISLLYQFPQQKNKILRLMEPIEAPEEKQINQNEKIINDTQKINFEYCDVMIKAAGNIILQDVTLKIKHGEKIGIVGPSGAGKSSFAGTLLGWYKPARGKLLINGNEINSRILNSLRTITAWIDPSVQLWNKTVMKNINYGIYKKPFFAVEEILKLSNLKTVSSNLPAGMESLLGEGGGLVSGGEGQRVRFARAIMRPGIKLAIMDEPFRGLDSIQRKKLLTFAIDTWKDATVLYITHEISSTINMDKVIVIEKGKILEFDSPAILLKDKNSRYNALLNSEAKVKNEFWDVEFSKVKLENGKIHRVF